MTNEERAIIKDMCHASHELHKTMRPELTDMRTAVRVFETGATRSPAEGKPEYAGYLHPAVIHAFGAYMLKHQTQSDGTQRDCRNHKKGIPSESYIQSGMRHWVEVWTDYEKSLQGYALNREAHIDSIMALLFNVMGYASNVLEDGE